MKSKDSNSSEIVFPSTVSKMGRQRIVNIPKTFFDLVRDLEGKTITVSLKLVTKKKD